MAGYIANRGKFKARLVAATLVRLAQDGAIKIVHESGCYRLVRIPAGPVPGSREEQVFLDALFARADSFALDRKQGTKALRPVYRPLKDALRQGYKLFLASNSHYLWRFLLLCLVAAGAGLWFIEQPPHTDDPVAHLAYGAFAVTVSGLLLLVCWRLLRAPTEAGSGLMDRIEAFRRFLAVNYETAAAGETGPGTGTPPSPEDYLAYAMALGIDSEYVSIRAASFEWYAGRGAGFSAHDFTASIEGAVPAVARPFRR